MSTSASSIIDWKTSIDDDDEDEEETVSELKNNINNLWNIGFSLALSHRTHTRTYTHTHTLSALTYKSIESEDSRGANELTSCNEPITILRFQNMREIYLFELECEKLHLPTSPIESNVPSFCLVFMEISSVFLALTGGRR